MDWKKVESDLIGLGSVIGGLAGIGGAIYWMFAHAEILNLLLIFLYSLGGLISGIVIGSIFGFLLASTPKVVLFVAGWFVMWHAIPLIHKFIILIYDILTYRIR